MASWSCRSLHRVMVVLGDEQLSAAGEHAIEHRFRQILDVVQRGVDNPESLAVAAGYNQEVAAGEVVVVAVGLPHIHDQRYAQCVYDVEYLRIAEIVAEVAAEAMLGRDALEARIIEQACVRRDI